MQFHDAHNARQRGSRVKCALTPYSQCSMPFDAGLLWGAVLTDHVCCRGREQRRAQRRRAKGQEAYCQGLPFRNSPRVRLKPLTRHLCLKNVNRVAQHEAVPGNDQQGRCLMWVALLDERHFAVRVVLAAEELRQARRQGRIALVSASQGSTCAHRKWASFLMAIPHRQAS
jgi:hypothetical protein